MTLKVGDRVEIVATPQQLLGHNCSDLIKVGSEYVILQDSGTGYYVDIECYRNHVKYEFVKPANEYTDEDWV